MCGLELGFQKLSATLYFLTTIYYPILFQLEAALGSLFKQNVCECVVEVKSNFRVLIEHFNISLDIERICIYSEFLDVFYNVG